MADSDAGKLFIGGISRDTSEATLCDHFRQYGDVLSSVIAKDRTTGSPRGFGFVSFADPAAADRALQVPHVILGRTVEVKKAIPRSEQQNTHNKQQQHNQTHHHSQNIRGHSGRNSSSGSFYGGNINNSDSNQFRTKKIFVGGLSANLTEEEFKGYFEQFGRITDVVVMHDNTTNRPRGFGFITFDSEEVVENIMQKSFHELAGKFVEVKKAVPKEGTKGPNNVYNNSRFVGGMGSSSGGQVQENYWSQSPGYGFLPGQLGPPTYPGAGGYYYGVVYGGGYPVSGYGPVGYGMHMVAPRSPWNVGGMVGVRPVPYSVAGFYPDGMNGGGMAVMGMPNSGNGIPEPGMEKSPAEVQGDGQIPVSDAARVQGGRADVDSLGLKSGQGTVHTRKNSRTLHGQSKASPVGLSS